MKKIVIILILSLTLNFFLALHYFEFQKKIDKIVRYNYSSTTSTINLVLAELDYNANNSLESLNQNNITLGTQNQSLSSIKIIYKDLNMNVTALNQYIRNLELKIKKGKLSPIDLANLKEISNVNLASQLRTDVSDGNNNFEFTISQYEKLNKLCLDAIDELK